MIYVVSSVNGLHRLHIEDCSIDFIVQIDRQAYDIAFHPGGTLYGISGNGNLYRIDTLTGNTTFVHDFGGQSFNSLTIAGDGLIYTIGDEGELWTYDLQNNSATFLGDVQYNATGDLAFFKGNLYVAVTGDRIVRIDLDEPDNSTVVIDQNIPGNILGIVSDIVECTDIHLYAITNGSSDIYEVDLDNSSLQLICQLNITVGGGASTTEFLSSSPLSIDSVIVTPVDCDFENGSLSMHTSGGIGTLTFGLLDSMLQAQNVLDGLDTGWYQVMVVDAFGCKDTADVFVGYTPSPYIDTVYTLPATCGRSNGQAELVIAGDTSGLQYSLDSVTYFSIPHFENLPPGLYTAHVYSLTSCPSAFSFQIDSITPVMILGADHLPTTCDDNNGVLAVIPSSAGSVLYAINISPFQSDSVFTDLASGLYSIRIRDNQGCMDTMSLFIPAEPGPDLQPAMILPASCHMANGQIIATASQGSLPYLFAIDSLSFQADSVFSGLTNGAHWLYVLDGNGCIDSAYIEVAETDPLHITSITTNPSDCIEATGMIALEVAGGHPPYVFALNGNAFTSLSDFAPLPQGLYHILIRDNEFCETEAEVIIPAQGCDVYMPNVFSPNGDGINDVVRPFIVEPEVIIDQFGIFDRWGNLVFLRENVPSNTEQVAWDGTFRNKALMPGVYAYTLTLRSANGTTSYHQGDITLIR